MDDRQTVNYNKWLHHFAILTAAVAVGLIVAGATVTSTESGDAVPDWPLSYGTLIPPMIGGILYEHSHRLIAGLTGIIIAILALWLWIKETRLRVKWIGIAVLAGVVFQAALGGLRVLTVSNEAVQDAAVQITGSASIESTRIAIAVSHAFLAQSIVCLLFAIALLTSRTWLSTKIDPQKDNIESKACWVGTVLTVLIFLQLILGAVIRHTEAGLIIPDFPLSFGRIIPPFGDLPNNPNAPFPITQEVLTAKVAVHFAHRVMAILILGAVIYLFKSYRKNAHIGKITKTILWLTIVQVSFGALNIWTAKSVFSTVSHVVVGALVLASGVIFALWTWRLQNLTSQISTSNKSTLEGSQTVGVG